MQSNKLRPLLNRVLISKPKATKMFKGGILLKNQEVESIIENTSGENEVSFSQEAIEPQEIEKEKRDNEKKIKQ